MNEVLPCGCRMWQDTIDGKVILMFEPHAMDCEYYLYLLAEGERQDKPTTIIDAR